MALVQVDLSEEATAKPVYEPLEAGKYSLEISNDLAVTMSSTNNPMIKVELIDTESGKKVRDNLTLIKGKDWKFSQFVKSAGVEEVNPGEVDLAEFKGHIVEALVEQEKYTKKDGTTGFSNKIQEYLFVA